MFYQIFHGADSSTFLPILSADDLLTDEIVGILAPEPYINIVSELSSLQESDVSVLDSEASIAHDDLSLPSLESNKKSKTKSKRKAKVKLEDADVIDLTDESNREQNQMTASQSAKLPRLSHSSLNDVRRHYARMFTNCVNSSDLQNVDSYFNTFMSGPCSIEVNHRITSTYGLPHRMDATGPRLFAHYLLGCYVTFPDLMIKLNDSRIVTSSASRGSKIVMEIEAHCTKIYDIPDYQWVPGMDELSQMYNNMSVADGAGASGGTDSNCGESDSDQDSSDKFISNYNSQQNRYPPSRLLAAQALHNKHNPQISLNSPDFSSPHSTLRPPPLSAIPQSFVERVVAHATLTAKPVPLVTKGVFTLYLDENHCMSRVVLDHWQQQTGPVPPRPKWG